jgi:Na+/phosphate symporter
MKPTARRTAIANLAFNVFGVLLFLPFLASFSNALVEYSGNPSLTVAWAHLISNLVMTTSILVLLKFFEGRIPD